MTGSSLLLKKRIVFNQYKASAPGDKDKNGRDDGQEKQTDQKTAGIVVRLPVVQVKKPRTGPDGSREERDCRISVKEMVFSEKYRRYDRHQYEKAGNTQMDGKTADDEQRIACPVSYTHLDVYKRQM